MANQSRPLTSLLTGNLQGIFAKTGLRRQGMSALFPAKSGRWAANSLLGETGNSLSQIRENAGPIREACRGFSEFAANGPSSGRRCRRRQARPRETEPVTAGQMSSSSDPARSRASSVVAWPRLWLSVCTIRASRPGRTNQSRGSASSWADRRDSSTGDGSSDRRVVQADIRRTKNPDAVGHSGQRRRR